MFAIIKPKFRKKKSKKREDHDRTRDTETTEAHSLMPISANESVGITSGLNYKDHSKRPFLDLYSKFTPKSIQQIIERPIDG